jgi:hypothetical protein
MTGVFLARSKRLPALVCLLLSKRLGLLGFWAFGLLGFWAFGLLGFWAFGLLGFWAFGLLGTF